MEFLLFLVLGLYKKNYNLEPPFDCFFGGNGNISDNLGLYEKIDISDPIKMKKMGTEIYIILYRPK